MKEKQSVFRYMIFGNKLLIVCVFFTLATILDIILCYIFRTASYTTFIHLIDRMFMCIIAALPLSLFKHFEKLSIWAIFPVHYAACCILAELYTFISGQFFYELHPDAYRDIFRSVTMMYLLIVIGSFVIDIIRTSVANKDLKKIQSIRKQKV